MEVPTVINTPSCGKCKKEFNNEYSLQRHLGRKISCDRLLECTKCSKIFTQLTDLKRHEKRKTTCAPIKGDPTTHAVENQCIYCRKEYTSKFNLNRHSDKCKIKNGGMPLLFKEIARMNKKIEDLELKCKNTELVHPQVAETINNIGVQNIQNNHFNTTINFNLIDFGGGVDTIKEILCGPGKEILEQKFVKDLPIAQQISDRVVNLVGLVFRNPEHKELQSIYVIDPNKIKDNAYYHDDGKWVLGDWETLRTQLLQNLFFHYKCIKNKNDAEGIMNLIYKLSTAAPTTHMNGEETAALLNEVGQQLRFNTIAL